MNVLGAFLDNRDAARQPGREVDAWMLSIYAPAERLLAFDGWVVMQLKARLTWPDDEKVRTRQIQRCRVVLEKLVLELWRREWLLDGPRLAKHVIAALDDVAAAQQAGRVKEFWPFFCRVVDSYVGINAEEIQKEARVLAGAKSAASIGHTLTNLIKTAAAGPTIPELVAQRRSEIVEAKTLRSKLSEERRKKVFRESEDGQLGLL
jgi:hypothetical protein